MTKEKQEAMLLEAEYDKRELLENMEKLSLLDLLGVLFWLEEAND